MVSDANAAVIPRLKIDVLRKRAIEEREVAETLSDEKAQFAFAPRPRDYVAIFSSQGFQARAVVFELLGNERWRGVQIAMTVDGSPQFPNVSPREWNPEKMNIRLRRRKSEVESTPMDLNDNNARRHRARKQCERGRGRSARRF